MPDVLRLKRTSVRHAFEQRFSAERMANDYVQIDRKLLVSIGSRPRASPRKLTYLAYERSATKTILCCPLLLNDQ